MIRRLALSLAATLCACAPPAPPPTDGANEVTVGEPWVGEPGITETVSDIMARSTARHAAVARPPKRLIDRSQLAENPDSPSVASWPDDVRRAEAGGGPAPQKPALKFLGEDSSGDAVLNFAPPDSMGAMGPQQYLFLSNGYARTFDRSGKLDGVLNAVDEDFFLSVRTPCAKSSDCSHSGCPSDGRCVTTDPRVFFDHLSQRFFVVMIDVANDDRVMLAVSSGPVITGQSSFTFFQFRQDAPGTCGTDCGGFFDQPTLGVDANALYIGGDMFNKSYIGTSGFVVNKAQLLAGNLVVTAFRQLAAGAMAPGPGSPKGVSNNDPNATVGYFIGADNASLGTLTLRRVTNPGGTGASAPAISGNVFITVPTTAQPINVPSQGDNSKLDGDNDRLKTAELRDGSLWCAHEIQVDATGVGSSSGGRDGVRWYELTNLGAATPTLRQSGTVFDPAASNPSYFWEPAIVSTGQGHVAIGASYAGASSFAGVAYTGRLVGDALGTTGTPTLDPGLAAYSGIAQFGVQRWGDYSFTSVDPADNMTTWTVQETVDAQGSWAVEVTQLLAPPPATPSLANPASAMPGAHLTVTVTGTALAGSGFYDPGSGFPNHVAATIDCAGVTVASTTYVDPTTLQLDVTVAAGAPLGACTITVKNPDGQSITSAPLFTVAGTMMMGDAAFAATDAATGAGDAATSTTDGATSTPDAATIAGDAASTAPDASGATGDAAISTADASTSADATVVIGDAAITSGDATGSAADAAGSATDANGAADASSILDGAAHDATHASPDGSRRSDGATTGSDLSTAGFSGGGCGCAVAPRREDPRAPIAIACVLLVGAGLRRRARRRG